MYNIKIISKGWEIIAIRKKKERGEEKSSFQDFYSPPSLKLVALFTED